MLVAKWASRGKAGGEAVGGGGLPSTRPNQAGESVRVGIVSRLEAWAGKGEWQGGGGTALPGLAGPLVLRRRGQLCSSAGQVSVKMQQWASLHLIIVLLNKHRRHRGDRRLGRVAGGQKVTGQGSLHRLQSVPLERRLCFSKAKEGERCKGTGQGGPRS